MDWAGLKLYKLDQWSSAFGDWPIYPYAMEESRRKGEVSYSARYSSFMVVNLILDGELCYRCGGDQEYFANAGEVFLIPVNSNYSFVTVASKYYHKLVLEVKGSLLPAISEALQLHRPLLLPAPTEIEADMRELSMLLRTGQENDIPAMLAKLQEILSRLSLAAREAPEDDMRMLAKAKSRLERDFDQTLSIAGLAAELGICYSTLNKLFRKKMDISPLQYRTQQKIESARHLLTHTSLSVKEISMRLGYSDQLYFSNDFKKHCGVSPKTFRQLSD